MYLKMNIIFRVQNMNFVGRAEVEVKSHRFWLWATTVRVMTESAMAYILVYIFGNIF